MIIIVVLDTFINTQLKLIMTWIQINYNSGYVVFLLASRQDGHTRSVLCPLEEVTLFTLFSAAGVEVPAVVGS